MVRGRVAISGPKIAAASRQHLDETRPLGKPYLSRTCRLSSSTSAADGNFSFSRGSHISRFNTSFFTFTFVALLDGFSQCCFATRANSDPSSATASTTSGAAFCELFAVLFFCLFAGGMMADIGRRVRHCVALLLSWTRQATLGNFVNGLEQRAPESFSLASLVDPSRAR